MFPIAFIKPVNTSQDKFWVCWVGNQLQNFKIFTAYFWTFTLDFNWPSRVDRCRFTPHQCLWKCKGPNMVNLQRNLSCKRVCKVSCELQYGVQPFFYRWNFTKKRDSIFKNEVILEVFNCEKKKIVKITKFLYLFLSL
jgi:hypothetical protein